MPETTAEIRAVAERAAADPFFLSDCEGELQVWRESALTHVRRDETGEIDMYSFPSSYRSTDQVIEIDLDSWDPGEDATDDQRRQDIGDLVTARAALPGLLARIAELEAVVANARKLVHGWLKSSADHISISQLDTLREKPLVAGMQDGRANQYSDCANELKDVLDGEDPDSWAHGVSIEVSAEAAS